MLVLASEWSQPGYFQALFFGKLDGFIKLQ